MLNDLIGVFLNRGDLLAELFAQHILLSLIAIAIAFVVGGAFGIFISEYEGAAKPTLGAVNFLYTIPSISMLGFLIPLCGVGNMAAVIALTIYALLPMVKNTHAGLCGIDPAIVEAAMGLGSTRWQALYKIKLPLAWPVIMTGIRSMATMTVALAGIASFIGAGGLGVAIYRGITTNNAAMTMAGSLLIALLALILDALLGIAERSFSRRSRNKKSRIARKLAAGILCLAVAGVFLSGSFGKGDTIRVATKPMTEQYIMGEMLKLLIEHDTNLSVKLTSGVGGGTSNIHPAMEAGEFDVYPEYTGTGWNMVLKESGAYDETKFATLDEKYRRQYRMRWLGMYGFNDTFGLVLRREIAEKYHIRSFSDLKKAAGELAFGAEYDFFEREDGYAALCRAYGLNFARTMDMDIGLKYQSLANGQIDVMAVFTTDGQLSAADAVVLIDDKHFFPSYVCGNVVREEVLEKHPQLEPVLEKLTGSISDGEMAAMNHKVEAEEAEPRDVAEEFLKAKGLYAK